MNEVADHQCLGRGPRYGSEVRWPLKVEEHVVLTEAWRLNLFQTENRMTTALDTRLGVFQPPDHGWGPVQTAVAASKKPECRTNPEFLLITSRMFIRTP